MKNDKKDIRMTRGMTVLYLLLTVVGGIAIIVNMVKIQWVHGDEWRERAERREHTLIPEPARRGNIYSSDGKILATTVKECDLYLDLKKSFKTDDKGNTMIDKKGRPIQDGPIVDSNFALYLDTVCEMLGEVSASHNAQYYRDRIQGERDRETPRRCFLVERRIPYSTWLSISRLPGWKAGVVKQVDGRSVVRQVRAHIYGNMAENTIGFSNGRENDTYTGLEGAYDSLLRGQDGLFNCRRLTQGMWLPDVPRERTAVPQRTDTERKDTVVVQNKIDGQSIVATLDTRYQDMAESSLRKALARHNATSGCAILMEVETGYVLACANLKKDSTGRFRERRDENVAVSHVYQPGSTFKSVVLTAMLNDPGITIDTATMFRVGSKNYNGGRKDGQVDDDHRVVDKEGKVRDSLNVREIIEQSSNVGMVEMGWHYYRMARRSDTLRKLMLEVFPYGHLNPDVKAREERTFIHEDMRPVSNFTRLCYGYSTQITPLQLITFYNALAADGRMVKPLFCRAIIDGKGRRKEIKPVVLNPKAFDAKKARMLKSMLVGVVNNGGTGHHLKSDTYVLAGKTGTAKKDYGYDASFAGFFPADNPRYTCIALLENSSAYGWQAGVVVKEIADCVVACEKSDEWGVMSDEWGVKSGELNGGQPVLLRGNQKEIQHVYQLVGRRYRSANPSSQWVYYQRPHDSVPGGYHGYKPAEGRIPNCSGMSAKDAVALLEEMGYRATVKGYGRVKSQSPRGGTAAKQGARVILNLN